MHGILGHVVHGCESLQYRQEVNKRTVPLEAVKTLGLHLDLKTNIMCVYVGIEARTIFSILYTLSRLQVSILPYISKQT